MEHIVALLLVVGCSDDLSTCQELSPPVVPVFETAEECEAVLPESLRTFMGQYPQILGKCIPVDPALEEEDAELAWNVKQDGTLVASVDVPEIVVAGASKGDRLFTAQE